jgi:hypothetical protein
LLTRAFVIWLVFLALAVVNGGVREALMVPRLGETFAHAISSVTLSATILIVSWFTIEWIRPTSASQTWRVGGQWFALTLAFEFLVGHYVFGSPWNQLCADYNVLKGRLWILVLVTTVSAPWITARGAALFTRVTE